MKSLLFLLLLVSANALPSALVLPASEISAREGAWLRANPSGFVSKMTDRKDCGAGQSMKPLLQPADHMAFEAYVGQKLKGSVVSINVPWCKLPVAHLVYDETATHVFLTGLNNSRSDGWQPKYANGKCQVNGVLVGILRKE